MTLRGRALTAVKWTALAAVIRGGLQVAQLAILARLLSPSDFGVMAIATAILSVANLLSDGGLSSAYIQRRNVTPEERSSLFWLNVILAAVVALILLLGSGLIQTFYGDERLQAIVALTASILLINGFGLQIRADAEKALRFRPLAICEIAAAFVGATVAVLSGYAGAGVFALVWGAISTALVTTILLWLIAVNGWRPSLRFAISDVRSYVRFGGAALGGSILNQFNSNVDLLIGGRLVTPLQLGLYSVSRNVVLQTQLLLNPVVTRVGFPLLAEAAHNQDHVRGIYLGALRSVAYVTAPIYAGGLMFAPQITTLLLGSEWIAATPYLQILCVWGFLRSVFNSLGSLLLGCGRPDMAFKWNAALLLLFPASIVAGALLLGAEGIAWALLTLSLVLVFPSWYYFVRRLCAATLQQYVFAFTIPWAYALLATAVASQIATLWQSPILQLGIGGFIAAAIYCVVACLANPGLAAAVKSAARLE